MHPGGEAMEAKKINRRPFVSSFISIILSISLCGCTSLKTPEINGVVVDAETGKPIEGAYVVAKWARTYSGPGGPSGGPPSKKMELTTDKNGNFKVPGQFFINWMPYPFGQGGTFSLAFYAHGHKNKKFVFYDYEHFQKPKYNEFKTGRNEKSRINLEEIIDPDTFDKNILEVHADNDYMISEYQLFTAKFPNDRRVSGYLLAIGNIYEQKMEKSKAIGLYEKIIKEWPNRSEAEVAQSRISTMNKAIQ